MECVIQFLDNAHQRELRLLAQRRSEKYEDTIEQYKKLFLVQLQYLKRDCGNKECAYAQACKIIKNEIYAQPKAQIEEFFNEIKNIYLLWIDSGVKGAFDKLNNLLERYQINSFKAEISNSDIFFKGRVSEEYLTRWDMFHIPFNKRHLIGNQRYSLTGQPIVYMGKSVVDLVEELGVKELENFKVSTIQLPDGIKVFDLRNSVLDDLIVMDIEWLLGISENFDIRNFYKLLLSSVCSFVRRQASASYSFCEEYVIPQLLAQVLKNKGYDGILYQSTKRFKDVDMEDRKHKGFEFSYKLGYTENIALFTKINRQHVYDQELFHRINISVPVTIDMIDEVSLEDLERIKEEINKSNKEQEKVTIADKIVSVYARAYDNIQYHGIEYAKSDVGKIHLYHLYEVLHQILID